jgi:hypothetical protein
LRQQGFFHPGIAVRSRLGQGVHDRCEAHLFAEGTVEDADLRRLASHLPFPVRMLSILSRHVGAAEVWDLTVDRRGMDVDERDDMLNVVNIGELVISPGGRVIVQGDLWVLGCQHLVHRRSTEVDGYQLGVLPTARSLDRRSGPLHGRPGRPGSDGGAGRQGLRPAGVPTMIGFVLDEPVADKLNGADGAPGAPGDDGESGRNGGAAKTAEITIGRLTGALTLLAAGGRGGNGGTGGHGGHGGDGGDAVAGFRTPHGTVPAGCPGRGGRGGDGGAGGHGGNGGISSNVFVTLPEASVHQLQVRAIAGAGGAGGAGGRPGCGGEGGLAIEAPNASAEDGAPGAPGKTGRNGRSRPAPMVFLNGRALATQETSP